MLNHTIHGQCCLQRRCCRGYTPSLVFQKPSAASWHQPSPPQTTLVITSVHSHQHKPVSKTRTIACAIEATSNLAYSHARQQPLFWKTHVSKHPNLALAVDECVKSILPGTTVDASPDLAIVFVSSAHANDYENLVSELQKLVPSIKHVFGCTGYGIIGMESGTAQEVENRPAISITLASIPQTEIVIKHIPQEKLPDGDSPPDRWSELLGIPAFTEQPLNFIILADPAFGGADDLLAGLDFAYPDANKIGGLTSAGALTQGVLSATWGWSASKAESASRGGVHRRGATVLALHGEVVMDLLIAQGCRPLTTTTWTLDKVSTDGRRIVSMTDDKGRSLPAFAAFQQELKQAVGSQPPEEIRRTLNNLTVGLAPGGMKDKLESQDFLIRGMLGFDSSSALVIGDRVRTGLRLKFMVRDKQGAQEDLQAHGTAYKRLQLQALMGAGAAPAPFGMLMFTCNGRGSKLYGQDSYDAQTIGSFVQVPCAGFQCNGEIGTVGRTTHIHGFTCAVGVLRPAPDSVSFPSYEEEDQQQPAAGPPQDKQAGQDAQQGQP